MAARVAYIVLVLCVLRAGSVVSVQHERHRHMRRQLKQAAPSGGNSVAITEACAATRFPASCLQALNGDPRSTSAVPRELVAIAIGVAHSYATTSEANAATLAAQVGGAGNVNLTSISSMCSEVTDLASFHIQNSQNAVNGPLLNDVQAWLSGALTFTTDCSAGLGQVSSVLPFVGDMKGRLDTSQEMISNALAMTDALVNYGANTALWKPPPLPKDYMLYETTSFTMQHELHSSRKLPHWLSPRDHKHLRGRLDVAPAVTVDLASPFSSIQRVVDLAPNWSGQRWANNLTPY